jgi:medium-chain acyl-[acyl-carrier-protein] hydrolase
MSTSLSGWSVPCGTHRGEPRVRLLCFPYAGGAATAFREWGDVLPADIQVHAVQLPGREWRLREEPFRRVEPLVDALAEALEPLLPAVFFGHSLGALIGFELARGLRARGLPEPEHLFVSAYRAPHLPQIEPALHDAPDEVFRTSLRTLDGTPEELLSNEELMSLVLPTIRADFELSDTYAHEPEAPLACPISVFGGLADHVTPRERLEPWSEHTTGSFKLRMVPGGHFFVNESRELVLRAIFQDLMGL